MMKIIEIIVLIIWLVSCGIVLWMWLMGRLKKNDPQLEENGMIEPDPQTIRGTGQIGNVSAPMNLHDFSNLSPFERRQHLNHILSSPLFSQYYDVARAIDTIHEETSKPVQKKEDKKPSKSKFNLFGD